MRKSLARYAFFLASLFKRGVNSVIFLRLFLDIKLLYFVGKTRPGYFLWISSLLVVYGTKRQDPGLHFLFCLIFVAYVIGTLLPFLVLVKVPRTRQYLVSLFGEEYLVAHLGPNMLTTIRRSLLTGLAGVVIIEKIAEGWDQHQHHDRAEFLEREQKNAWKEDSHTPSMAEQQKLLDELKEIRNQRPVGISDQVWQVLKDFRRE